MHPFPNNILVHAGHTAFRTLVPESQDRIPLTWSNAPYLIASLLPFFLMAHLARRPDTHLLRLLLLPITLCALVGAAHRFVWNNPVFNLYNWGQGASWVVFGVGPTKNPLASYAAVAVAKSVEFAFHEEGMLKTGETRPGVATISINGTEAMTGSLTSKLRLTNAVFDALELVHALRGIGWKFGQGQHIPVEKKTVERIPFLLATFKSFISHFLLLDLLDSLVKQLPSIGSVEGGSIFYPHLSPVWRYTVSTSIHTMTGTAILAGFNMVYSLVTMIAVGCFDSPPTSWPPMMDNPWVADSMHTFWGRRWHQMLRQTFLVLGGYPGRWIAGDYGMLFGVFTASGLWHECSIYAMDRGFDSTVVLFFMMQAPVLLFERLWRQVTGQRLGGWFGRLWVYSIIFVGGQIITDSWHKRGMGGGMVVPPPLSPVRLFLIPIFKERLHGLVGMMVAVPPKHQI